jgi:TonB family protein
MLSVSRLRGRAVRASQDSKGSWDASYFPAKSTTYLPQSLSHRSGIVRIPIISYVVYEQTSGEGCSERLRIRKDLETFLIFLGDYHAKSSFLSSINCVKIREACERRHSVDSDLNLFKSVDIRQPQRRGLHASLLAHVALVVVLLIPSTPIFIQPSTTLAGKNGTSTVYLYLPSPSASSTVAQELNTEENRHLLLPTPPAKKKQDIRKKPALARTPQELHEAESALTNQPPAGSLYGSLSYGKSDGSEVRPAIRVSGSEPAVYPWDLGNVPEGNIIVEVTIDERGNITNKIVLQSLNPTIDHKVLAALEDWHFLPALRDGDAISSKQDIYYHYPVPR